MPTISDLRLQAATIKNATQVGENTATRVGTTFETIADLLEQQGVGQGVPSVDLSQLNTLRTPADQTTANPTIYNVTTLHNLSSTTIKVGTLFIFSDGGRAVVTQVLLSNYQVDGGGNISSPNTSQITMYYRMFNIVQETWSAWTLYGGGGGGGTIDPYPVSGSSNAVESNGVFEGLQKAAPEVNINDIDDLDDFVDMQTGVASTYTIKAYHNLSSTWLRVGVLMVFANQAQNTLTQICISNCMVDGGGNLIPNYTTNMMNVFYRFKQFSGVPPEGMTIGVWTTWAKFGDSGYQPDNEDIDLNASDQLQFANKAYDASAFSGLGRVYLRKNIVTLNLTDKYFDGFVNNVLVQDVGTSSTPDAILFDTTRKMFVARVGLLYYVDWGSDEDYNPITRDVNWNYNGNFYRWNGEELAQWDKAINQLTQAMFNTANTIYHIQYDYDLNGQTITMPAGCVLEFEGGSLANGTLAGSNTAIDADNVVIFGDDIIVSGTWLIPNIYSDWFANITETNRIKNLFRLTNSAITNNVYIKKTSEPYKVAITRYSEEWRREDIIDINTDNNNVYIDGTIQLEANGMWGYNIITINNVNNIKISGGTIIGDALEHDYSTYQDSYPTHEFGHGIGIIGSNNIEIENIDIKLCTGDCVCFERFDETKINNVVIRNFLFEQARRQGISITENVENVQIVNGTIQNIGDLSETITGASPKHAIDIEPASGYASNIFISNLDIHDCTGGGIMTYNNGNADINNIAIENIIYNTEAENRNFGVEFYAVKNARLNGYIGNIGVSVNSCRGCKLSHIYIKDGIRGNLFAGTSTIQIEDMVADITDNDTYLFNLYNGSSVKVLAKNCKVSCNKLLFVAQGSSIVIEDSELNFSWHYCTTPECLYKNCNMNIVCGDETISYFSAENCIINISEIKKLLPITFYKVTGCDVTASTDVEGRTVFYGENSKAVFSNNKVVSNSSLMAILLWDNAFKIEDNVLSYASGISGRTYWRRGGCTPTSYGLLSKYGDTRPTIANNAIEYKGFPFFDTTLNKMIYWTGTSWVDATGAAVQ